MKRDIDGDMKVLNSLCVNMIRFGVESDINSANICYRFCLASCLLVIQEFGDTQKARDELNKLMKEAWSKGVYGFEKHRNR